MREFQSIPLRLAIRGCLGRAMVAQFVAALLSVTAAATVSVGATAVGMDVFHNQMRNALTLMDLMTLKTKIVVASRNRVCTVRNALGICARRAMCEQVAVSCDESSSQGAKSLLLCQHENWRIRSSRNFQDWDGGLAFAATHALVVLL